MLKAIVFDFDGVVLESNEVKTRAFATLFADHPTRQQIVEHHLANLGVSRYDKFRYIYSEILERELTEEAMVELDHRFSALVRQEILACPFVPGAPEALETLARRLPLFIASATPESELREIVKARGLTVLFRGVLGSPRPKEDLLREVLQTLDVEADAVVFVGDTMNDLGCAQRVGMSFVGRVVDAERNPFPNTIRVVADLRELEGVLSVSG